MRVAFEGGGLLEPTAVLHHAGVRHALGSVLQSEGRYCLVPSALGERLGLPPEGFSAPSEAQLAARIGERVAVPGYPEQDATGPLI